MNLTFHNKKSRVKKGRAGLRKEERVEKVRHIS